MVGDQHHPQRHVAGRGRARRLGVAWRTVWEAIVPILSDLAADTARFKQVSILGVDEHVWHHTPRAGKRPKELTGMIDLYREDRIRGPVQLCWVALLLIRVAENTTGLTWRSIRHELDRMHLLTLATPGRHLRPTHHHHTRPED